MRTSGWLILAGNSQSRMRVAGTALRHFGISKKSGDYSSASGLSCCPCHGTSVDSIDNSSSIEKSKQSKSMIKDKEEVRRKFSQKRWRFGALRFTY